MGRKVQGFGYKFNNELHVSVNPVIGGWPLELELDDSVTLVPVTTYELRVNGEKLTVGQAMSRALLTCADQADAEAKFRMAKQEAGILARAERAKAAAEKAVAKANELAKKAAEAAAKAQAKAAELTAGAAKKAVA